MQYYNVFQVFEDDSITDNEGDSLEEKETSAKRPKHTKQNTIKYVDDEEDSGGEQQAEEREKQANEENDGKNVQNEGALKSKNNISMLFISTNTKCFFF